MALQSSEVRLKVLVVDEEIPYPPNTGKRIRTWNLLKRLAQRHAVHFLCYGRAEDPATQEFQRAGISVRLVQPLRQMSTPLLYARLLCNLFSPNPFSVTKHYSGRFQKAFDQLLKEGPWDLIQCEWTPYARFLSHAPQQRVLIATHNIESQIWQRRAENSSSFIEKVFFGLQKRKMKWFEHRALLHANAATAVTVEDARVMRQWGVGAVTVVPNGVDTEFYRPVTQIKNENVILSVASLDWFPNVDALQYFVREVFPIIQKKVPDAIFRIVGRRPPKSLRDELSKIPDVDLVGEVSDVRPYIEQASVIVVPLRIGGGSRLKILEALAAGKAVVSTSVGAEGLDLEGGKHLLMADSADDLASHVCELLGSEELRRSLSEEGKRFVSKHYDWGNIAARLENAWVETAQRGPVKMPVTAAAREIGVAS